MQLLTLFPFTLMSEDAPNGERYPRVGGTRQRRFDGTSLQPRNLPENAATPTRRVHAVLGGSLGYPDLAIGEVFTPLYFK